MEFDDQHAVFIGDFLHGVQNRRHVVEIRGVAASSQDPVAGSQIFLSHPEVFVAGNSQLRFWIQAAADQAFEDEGLDSCAEQLFVDAKKLLGPHELPAGLYESRLQKLGPGGGIGPGEFLGPAGGGIYGRNEIVQSSQLAQLRPVWGVESGGVPPQKRS